MEEIIWIVRHKAHLPDSCSPVFLVETLQYYISQMILQPHLNDTKCLLESERESESRSVPAHLFLWRVDPELILLAITGLGFPSG